MSSVMALAAIDGELMLLLLWLLYCHWLPLLEN